MKIQTLQLRRDLVLMAYEAGKITRETARAKCRVLTQAIERLYENGKKKENKNRVVQ